MTKNEFIKQYAHTWRVFERLVKDFDTDAWLHAGRGANTSARMALHILQSAKYYLEDTSEIVFASGKSFESRWETAEVENLPSQNDIVICIHEMKERTEKWLTEMDYRTENKAFPWAGETKLGVVIFLLRHTLFHIGELSSLLNESKNGDVEDHYVKAI
ncbi:MAG: hypothetical protein DWQ04_16185 [Chloroflexi bacterium]|nr:MAG: hypothetical protein DWQ04_16185 [Chloroflexota bacterium]